MTGKLQLDVCDHNQWWRHLVNAYEVEAGMVFFAEKLYDSYLSTFGTSQTSAI